MAGKGAVSWFRGKAPLDFSQQMSITADALEGKAEEVVAELAETAKKRMQEIIKDGGIYPTKKGGARIESGDMYASVEGKVSVDSGNRVQGEFGFIDNAPFYTRFQERGTRSSGPMRNRGSDSDSGGGIAPMLAYATALGEAITEFQDKVDSVHWFATSNLSQLKRK
jgi:hypothetical protein